MSDVERHSIHDIVDDKKVIVGVDLGMGGDKTVISVMELKGKSRKLKATFVSTPPVYVGKFSPLPAPLPALERWVRGELPCADGASSKKGEP